MEMKINFATYFDSNYYSKFYNLYNSLLKNCPNFHLYCLVLDKFKIDDKIIISPNVTILTLEELERSFPELYYAKKNRSLVEYYFTLTPFILRYIFKKK